MTKPLLFAEDVKLVARKQPDFVLALDSYLQSGAVDVIVPTSAQPRPRCSAEALN